MFLIVSSRLGRKYLSRNLAPSCKKRREKKISRLQVQSYALVCFLWSKQSEKDLGAAAHGLPANDNTVS